MSRLQSLAALVLACTAARLAPALQETDEAPETELAGHMEHIEDTVKLLRKSLKDPATHPAALEALVEIQRTSVTCKSLAPHAAADIPEPERAAFVTAYRRSMVDFLMRQLELEAAILDGDTAGAQKAFDRFHEMEDSAHERFAPEED